MPHQNGLRVAGPWAVGLGTAAQASGTELALDEDAADGRDAEMDELVFGQKLREMGRIAAVVAVLVEGHHALFERIGQGVNGFSAPIAVGDGLSTSLAVFGLEPIRMADADAEATHDVLLREMTIQLFLEDHDTFEFVLHQGNLLLAHRDIFTEQLHLGNITAQQPQKRRLTNNSGIAII